MPQTRIHADLTIIIDDALEITVSGEGTDTLTVQVPSLRAGLAVWRRHRQVLQPLLPASPPHQLPVTVQFVVTDNADRETVVATWGADASPGILERLIGIYPLDVNLWQSLRTVLR